MTLRHCSEGMLDAALKAYADAITKADHEAALSYAIDMALVRMQMEDQRKYPRSNKAKTR